MIIRKIYQRPDGATIEFVPVKNVPGFSHRVILNGSPVDWLSNTSKPSVKVATYFFDKHQK